MLENFRFEAFIRIGTGKTHDGLSARKEHNGRDRRYLPLSGKRGFFIDIDFDGKYTPLQFSGDLGDDGTDHLTGTAPIGIKIH